MPHATSYPEPRGGKFLFASRLMVPLWAVVHVYLGWLWLSSDWGKATSPAWVGAEAGVAVTSF